MKYLKYLILFNLLLFCAQSHSQNDQQEQPIAERGILQQQDFVQVELIISPDITTTAYAIEENWPVGFTVSNISEFGAVDSVNNKIKWGPFLDNQSRTITYTLTPVEGYKGAKALNGWISVDGTNTQIQGDRHIVFSGTPDISKGERKVLQSSDPIEISLSIQPLNETNAYAVEELIPEGLSVVSISDQGLIDASNNKIKWGPFFDNTPRTLIYTISAPDSYSGTVVLTGFISFDGQLDTIGGDLSLEIENQQETPPVIDAQPVGGSVSFGESFTLTVSVSGSVSSYQWFKNNQSLAGANLPFLILNDVQQDDLGEYYVQIVGPGGSVTSEPVLLRQADLPPQGPRIDPESITFINIGNLQQMALTSSSTPSKTYQVVMKSDLNDPEWIPVGPMQIANGTTVTFLIDVTDFETGFFQVREN
jgi:hypothetical protein